MKRALARAAFSLVEVTLALGVAAFCLLAVLGLLPIGVKTNQAATNETIANGILSAIISDLRTMATVSGTKDKQSKQFKVYFPKAQKDDKTSPPVYLYFAIDGSTAQGKNGPTPNLPDSNTVFYVTISYMPAPAGYPLDVADSMAAWLFDVQVAWPYAGVQPPSNGPAPAGVVETFLSVDSH
jgi:uncharacterized protein (TIGR02598 family)